MPGGRVGETCPRAGCAHDVEQNTTKAVEYINDCAIILIASELLMLELPDLALPCVNVMQFNPL